MKRYQRSLILSIILLNSAVCYASWVPYVSVGGGWQYVYSHPDVQGARTYDSFVQEQFNNSISEPLASMALGLSQTIDKAYYALQVAANYNFEQNASDTWVTMDATGSAPAYYNTLSSKMPWRFELDGIAGYYFAPLWLLYGKLGATTAKLQANFEVGQYQEEPAATPSVNMQLYGVVLGLGLRRDISTNWHVGVEGDYVRFFNTSQSTSTTFKNDPNPVNYTFNYNPQVFLVQASLSYSF